MNCPPVEPVVIRRNDKQCFSNSALDPSNSQASKDEKDKKSWFRLVVNMHSGVQQRYPHLLGRLRKPQRQRHRNVAKQAEAVHVRYDSW